MFLLKKFIKETIVLHEVSKNASKDFGLFISVPDHVIRQIETRFPAIKNLTIHDDSPNHITVLIINDDYEQLDKVKDIVTSVLTKFSPFKITLSGTDTFHNEKRNENVLFNKIFSEQLIKLHYVIKNALENENIKINHFYGENDIQVYEPHMTLAYYENDSNDNNQIFNNINISWLVDRIEMWGNMSPILFRLEK